jgi:hypothetical protein
MAPWLLKGAEALGGRASARKGHLCRGCWPYRRDAACRAWGLRPGGHAEGVPAHPSITPGTSCHGGRHKTVADAMQHHAFGRIWRVACLVEFI